VTQKPAYVVGRARARTKACAAERGRSCLGRRCARGPAAGRLERGTPSACCGLRALGLGQQRLVLYHQLPRLHQRLGTLRLLRPVKPGRGVRGGRGREAEGAAGEGRWQRTGAALLRRLLPPWKPLGIPPWHAPPKAHRNTVIVMSSACTLAVQARPVHRPSAPRPPQNAITTDSGSPITQYVTWGRLGWRGWGFGLVGAGRRAAGAASGHAGRGGGTHRGAAKPGFPLPPPQPSPPG
jgi:hypothetical protein